MHTDSNANFTMNLKEMTGAMSENSRVLRGIAVAFVAGCFMLAMAAMPARSDALIAWDPVTYWGPTVLEQGKRAGLAVYIGNVGDETAKGWPDVEIKLPPGVTMDTYQDFGGAWACDAPVDPQTVVCTSPLGNALDFTWPPPYTYLGGVFGINAAVQMTLEVDETAPLGVHDLSVTASGGGAAEAAVFDAKVTIDDAPGGFGAVSGTFEAGAKNADGSDFTQAGGRPDHYVTGFVTNKKFNDPDITGNWTEMIEPDGGIKDVVVDLPPGFVGNPQAIPECTVTAVMARDCPPSSQVGIAEANNLALPPLQMFAVYNVTPPKNAPAQFAFYTDGGPVVLTPVLRSDGDWGLTINAKSVTEATPLFATRITIWGNPASPSKDYQRCFAPSYVGDTCSGHPSDGGPPLAGNPDLQTPHSSGIGDAAFLSHPTRCTGEPESTTLHLSPWGNAGSFQPDGDPDLTPPTTWTTDVAVADPLTGCSKLSFIPSIEAQLSSQKAGGPAGLTFKLTIPQNDDPDGLATAHMKDAVVTFPVGTVVNASSADGLASCSSTQIGLTSKDPIHFTKLEPTCPLASKIGTVEVDTPLLDDPLKGDVFLAAQNDHPFDSLVAMYMVVRGPGILGKLAARVDMNGDNGQITATVLDNPQLPFETLTVKLKTGDRAPLLTPSTCGTHKVTSRFESWGGQVAEPSDSFTVDCPGNADLFDPTFAAGTSSPVAGDYSPFRLRITRNGGKELGRLALTLPKGLLANPSDVAVCSESVLAALEDGDAVNPTGRSTQAAPSCPTESQHGTVTTGVGGGGTPFFPLIPGTDDTGRVFLTGPHQSDAPVPAGLRQTDYGLAIEVPAVAGPFDLGTVLVRAAIYADPTTAQLTLVTDKLPRILRGIPLDIRDLRADDDRPGFVRNPTSCREQQVTADISAQDGTTVRRSSRFQVGDCGALAFKPRLALRLTGRRQMSSEGHPGIRSLVRQKDGEAGIKKVQIRLPKSLALDPDNAQALCEFEEGIKSEPNCPAGSIVGRARAVSPLLKQPLSGNVYFVKNVRIDPDTGARIRTLPMLVVALRGEVDVNLRGQSSVKGGKLVTTFGSVPDAPISAFRLNLKGGSNGILVVTETARGRINLCSGKQVAEVDSDGQNGKRRDFNVRMKTPCKKRRKR